MSELPFPSDFSGRTRLPPASPTSFSADAHSALVPEGPSVANRHHKEFASTNLIRHIYFQYADELGIGCGEVASGVGVGPRVGLGVAVDIGVAVGVQVGGSVGMGRN